ncbi:MAG TPA: hypothetical protein VF134_08175 [Candidatus Dormibacteraeota bacterium]
MALIRRVSMPADTRAQAFAIPAGLGPALAFLAALVPALVVAFQQPVWSRVDEAQHFDYIAQLAHGTLPVSDRTTLRPETVKLMDRTGIYRWFQPNGDAQPTDTDPGNFQMPPAGISGQAASQWMWRHIWFFSYEAQQPPLYYAAMTPFWIAADKIGGPLAAVYVLRVISALMLAALAPLAWLLARELLPGHEGFAAASGIVATVPGITLNLSQVTNDVAAGLLGAIVVWLAVRGVRRGFTVRSAILIGALFGAALLTKITTGGLALALAFAFLFARQLRLGLLAAGVAAVLFAPWLALNQLMYARALPPHDFMGVVFAAQPLSLSVFKGDVLHAFQTFWTGEPVGTLPLEPEVMNFALLWMLLACFGLLLVGVWARLRFASGGLIVVFGAVAGEAVLAVALPALSHVGGLTPGRYLYPAATAAMTLMMAGTWNALPILPLRAGVVTAFAGVSIASLAGFLHGLSPYDAVLQERYAGPPASSVPVDANGYYDDVHVTVDRYANDSAHGDIWIHVKVDNTASTSAEWWPRPNLVLDGSLTTRTDYGRSERLPETLRPHSHYEAWLVAPAGAPGSHHKMQGAFEALAVYDYHTIGNLFFDVDLPD